MTKIIGYWKLNKQLDKETRELFDGLCSSERIKRIGLPEKYGIDGEFYHDNDPKLEHIADRNHHPRTQPSSWAMFYYVHETATIHSTGCSWDIEAWLKYFIENIFAPRGYILCGIYAKSIFIISVTENVVRTYYINDLIDLVKEKEESCKRKRIEQDNNCKKRSLHKSI